MDKLLKAVYDRANKCCDTCEMYMWDKNKRVCAGADYGKHTSPFDVCDEWEPEINYYLSLCEQVDNG